MKVANRPIGDGHPASAEHFSLPASRHDLIQIDDPPSSALLVSFGPGGRTHWHRHPGGQYLHVVDGDGWIRSRGGEVQSIGAGDTIYAAPGEEHWHGATRDRGMTHLAFSFGITEWVGPVEDDGE